MTRSANQVLGNRLKLLKPVKAYIGHPNSTNLENWNKGKITAPVYSYIERPDAIWWQIGEIEPRYVKHETGAFRIVPDSGGADQLKQDQPAPNIKFGTAGIFETAQQMFNWIKWPVYMVLFYYVLKIISNLTK